MRRMIAAGRALLGAGLLALCVAGAAAQDSPEVNFDAWAQTVDAIDRVLDADQASDERLQELRREVVAFRDRFAALEGANADRLQRLRSQLEALGPPPEDGNTEPPEVGERRRALTAEIDALSAPSVRATEALAEANALVAQIDAELRERATREAFRRYPVPVNPLNWIGPILDLREAVHQVPREIALKLNDPNMRRQITGNLPSAAVSAIAGLLLLGLSQRWAGAVATRVNAIERRVLRRSLRLTIVIAQLALPWLGLVLLLGGVQLSGALGATGSGVLRALGAFGFVLIGTTWMVNQVCPPQRPEASPLRITTDRVRRARRSALLMAMALSLNVGLRVLGGRVDLDPVTTAYMGAVLALIAAVALFRTGQLFRRSALETEKDGSETVFADGVIAVLGSLAMLVPLIAIAAGASGYLPLSQSLLFPSLATFFLFGVLAMVQRAVREFYALVVTGGRETELDNSLFPTLFGAVLILAAVPVLALLWGARVTDLTEAWRQVTTGFTVGGVQVSPAVLLRFFGAFVVGYTLTRLIQGGLRNSVLPKTRMDTGARNALVSGVGYLGVFLAGLFAFTAAGIDLSSFAIFASALAVGIGFGLQTIVSNFVSGIILLIERPISEGDWIEVNGQMGIVKKISVRATRIEQFDRTDLIIPNSDLVSGVVTNWTGTNNAGRVIVTVTVAHGTDTQKVDRVLTEIANAHPIVSITDRPLILLNSFSTDGIVFEVRVILRDVNFILEVASELNHEIARRFAEEGITIPHAQRDLWVRTPEAAPTLQPAMAPVAHATGRSPGEPD